MLGCVVANAQLLDSLTVPIAETDIGLRELCITSHTTSFVLVVPSFY